MDSKANNEKINLIRSKKETRSNTIRKNVPIPIPWEKKENYDKIKVT